MGGSVSGVLAEFLLYPMAPEMLEGYHEKRITSPMG